MRSEERSRLYETRQYTADDMSRAMACMSAMVRLEQAKEAMVQARLDLGNVTAYDTVSIRESLMEMSYQVAGIMDKVKTIYRDVRE